MRRDKVKVKVFRAINGRWYWGHECHGGGWSSGPTRATNLIDPPIMGTDIWAQALRAAQVHAKECL